MYIFYNSAIDPQNKGFLTYDEFYKNLLRIAQLTHPEAYVIYKQCLDSQKNLLSMKQLFKALGGAWSYKSYISFTNILSIYFQQNNITTSFFLFQKIENGLKNPSIRIVFQLSNRNTINKYNFMWVIQYISIYQA